MILLTPEDERAAAQRLSEAGVEGAARDVRVLARWAADEATFARALEQRAKRRPVSKIIGTRSFWMRDFIVTDDVLDPRPDTETLVEAALKLSFSDVLDLGTGSGCILLSLLEARPDARGVGVDMSEAALAVARRNGAGTPNARFTQSDWFSDVTGQFDLIVSNPPYIAADEMADLAPDVRDYDPRLALTDEGDGLTAYRLIARHAGTFLTRGGHVLLEIGWTQGAAVSALFDQAGFTNIEVICDLAGKPRVISMQLL